MKSQKRHPRYDLPQTCGGSKNLCPVWINPTENMITHLRKISGSMNSDPISMIHTSRQSTKEGLKGELEGYFR